MTEEHPTPHERDTMRAEVYRIVGRMEGKQEHVQTDISRIEGKLDKALEGIQELMKTHEKRIELNANELERIKAGKAVLMWVFSIAATLGLIASGLWEGILGLFKG